MTTIVVILMFNMALLDDCLENELIENVEHGGWKRVFDFGKGSV